MEQIDGFLLTRHWRDTPSGIVLSYWAQTDQGLLQLRYPGQQAICFIARQQTLDDPLPRGIPWQRRSLALHDLRGQPVDGLYFRQQRQLAPAADGILHFPDQDFEQIVGDQMALFLQWVS